MLNPVFGTRANRDVAAATPDPGVWNLLKTEPDKARNAHGKPSKRNNLLKIILSGCRCFRRTPVVEIEAGAGSCLANGIASKLLKGRLQQNTARWLWELLDSRVME